MPIRPATSNDLPIMAHVLSSAFRDEEMIARVVPRRHDFPDDYVRVWRHKLREDYWDYAKKLEVSYEVDEKGGESVVGVAVWKRYGTGWEGVWGVRGWWDPRLLITKLIKTLHKLHRTVFGNKASPAHHPTPSNPKAHTWWTWQDAVMPYIAKYWVPPTSSSTSLNSQPTNITTTNEQPFWELSILGVHTSHQNRGHGRDLVTHGLTTSVQSLPCVVMAADGKEGFYRACGFGNLVGRATDGGEGNPLREMGIRGGAIIWTTF